MSESYRRGLALTTGCAVFCALMLFHTYPLGLGDAYWHLSTGRWIVEHGALPTSDPFLYTLPPALDERQMLLLQGYWLAQVLFYAVHAVLGEYGLIGLKALVFAAIYATLWRVVRARGVADVVAWLALLPLPLLFYRYDELRPQLFSFLGTVLVYACLDWARAALRAGVRWPPSLLMLPAVMLLWANLHRGYILGAVLILVALGAEVWRSLRRCQVMDPRSLRRYAAVCALALGASCINPAGFDAYIIDLRELGSGEYRGVDEFLPLHQYAAFFGEPALFYGPLLITLVLAVALAIRWRKLGPADVVNFTGFAAAGFASFRFMLLAMLIVLAVGLPHAWDVLKSRIERARWVLLVIALIGAAGLACLGWQRSALRAGPLEAAYVPQRAADFVLTRQLPAQLFSPYEYGGYLEWRLGERHRLFYDQRSMDNAVYAEYVRARDGRYADLFARYGIRTVVFYLFTPVLNTVPPIVPALLTDPRWEVVYVDRIALVAVRRDSNTLPVLDKARILQYVQSGR